MESAPENPSQSDDLSTSGASSTQRVMVEGTIAPVKVSFGYKIGLCLVALTMVLLPILYFCLVALFGYAIYYHATENLSIFSWRLSGRAAFLKLLLYFGPIIIGLILLLFLFKPLFAKRAEEDTPYSLEHSEAPLLFQLIGQVCQAIGAPIPSRVDLDCSINASASFRKGFGSFFGNDVMLTLGLPLVAGLTIQQLAGLMAHEFGHFAQGAAMRLSYLIRTINQWFARVVYERDAWDVWLIETSEELDLRISWIFYFARLGVWMSRRVLWVMMTFGHGISSFMLRQMEHDADRYELRIGGTDAFLATSRQINHLNAAAEAVRKKIRNMLKERKLFDNTPELVVRFAREVPADIQAKLHASWESEKTKWYDSHPSYADRNARAIAAAEPGCVHSPEPATALFTDFSDLSRRITLAHYRDAFGCDVPPEALIPVQPANAIQPHDYASDTQTAKDYFNGVLTSLRPLHFPETKPLSFRNGDALMNDVQEARLGMEQLRAAGQSAYLNFKEADERELLCQIALTLIEAGVQFDPAELGMNDLSHEAIAAQLSAAEQQRNEADASLTQYEQAALRRLISCLQLIRVAPIATKLQNSIALQDEAAEMLWLLGQLSPFFEEALRLRVNSQRLETLLRYREGWSHLPSFADTAKNLGDEIARDVGSIQQRTAGTRLPFPDGPGFIGGFLKNKEYSADPLEMLLREGNSHFEKTISIYYRALARLVALARQVEQAIPAKETSTRLRVSPIQKPQPTGI